MKYIRFGKWLFHSVQCHRSDCDRQQQLRSKEKMIQEAGKL